MCLSSMLAIETAGWMDGHHPRSSPVARHTHAGMRIYTPAPTPSRLHPPGGPGASWHRRLIRWTHAKGTLRRRWLFFSKLLRTGDCLGERACKWTCLFWGPVARVALACRGKNGASRCVRVRSVSDMPPGPDPTGLWCCHGPFACTVAAKQAGRP